jgi:hypothetical protein
LSNRSPYSFPGPANKGPRQKAGPSSSSLSGPTGEERLEPLHP